MNNFNAEERRRLAMEMGLQARRDTDWVLARMSKQLDCICIFRHKQAE